MTQARRAPKAWAFAGFGIRLAAVFGVCGAGMAMAHAEAPSLAVRRAAVESTLAHAGSCQRLGDYYWEIGDAKGVLMRGQHGQRISANKTVRLASASKWVFGAYVAERTHGKPTPAEIDALTMRSGYDGLNPLLCNRNDTVQSCFERGRNSTFTPGHVGRFSYNGGHDQKLLINLGFGGADADTLSNELDRQLANTPGLRDADKPLGIRYLAPEPGGGMIATPSTYGQFLRRLMRGEYELGKMLGQHAVCTEPGTCANAVSTPAALPWHYALNYWIEDHPGGDGAFSSPGAFGFYPWITADKRYYGMLVRETLAPRAYVRSAACGALIRRAFAEGLAQHPAESAGTPDFAD
ncbi:serine hydrolase [Ralstonia soli]|uniref:Serine hydrolase n=1 Tax=Ralstonia soli TaxID=2953896 RepID=A0ABT1AM68_9RALS|nr:serine hydrolase [Ralstonia soli]MCO5399523.1 serine hydrolase [Ralstonia soli]